MLTLAELARIAGGVQAALDRISIAITRGAVRPGARPAAAVAAVQLSITGLQPGSVNLCLVRTGQAAIDGERLLDEALDALAVGVGRIADQRTDLPESFTMPLVNGLRDLAGAIGPGKLTRIDVIRSNEVLWSIDERFRRNIRNLSIDLTMMDATIVGRLHMGDFSPASLRCRIDGYAGSILCDFDTELKDIVLDAMDEVVMASGLAQLQPDGSTIRTLHLTELGVLPTASVAPRTLKQLAAEQGIGPVQTGDELAGPAIPDDEYDAFLTAIGRSQEGAA
jgi:hypothetical protein